ncbi:MAG: aldehyde ferredoxin oxidoreductase N-terminal domain-containing protein, partial [Spirochaetota bacterium]
MALTAFIDLSREKITIIETPVEVVQKFLGSRGYAAKILYDNVGVEVDPL